MKRKLWLTALIAMMLMLMLPFAVKASAEIKAIRLKYPQATLHVGKSGVMPIKVKPAARASDVRWVSSNTKVATVDENGKITAVAVGSAVITARASDGSGVEAICELIVKAPAIKKVMLNQKQVNAKLIDGSYQLEAKVKPATASVDKLKWTTSDKSVATVSNTGLVTFVDAGDVKIAAVAPNGKKAVCTFYIQGGAPTRRALVIGEGRANATYRLTALSAAQSEVEDIANMFSKNGVDTRTLLNRTRAEVIASIKSLASLAKKSDVSYVYITCHGGKYGNTYRMFPCGDGFITAVELYNMLEQVPGKVVVMIGSCSSGAVISKDAQITAASAPSSQDGNVQAFIDVVKRKQPTPRNGELKNVKFQVLCACKGSENGYGVKTVDASGRIVESKTYNFFGKAVSEGGNGAADSNGDGKITMKEMQSYAFARVKSFHALWRSKVGSGALGPQSVVSYPEGSDFVLFG